MRGSAAPANWMLILLLLLAGVAGLPALAPPRTIAPPRSIVDDELIGYLLAFLQQDMIVQITGADLLSLFPEYDEKTPTLMDRLVSFERSRSDSERFISLRFNGPLDHPAPLDVLGLKPVILKGSPSMEWTERVYGSSDLAVDPIQTAYVLHIQSGTFFVDFAGWLDFLLGSIVDDLNVDVVLALVYEGRWYGAMAGYNPKGKPVTGVYDMQRNRFLARPPQEIEDFLLGHLRPRHEGDLAAEPVNTQ